MELHQQRRRAPGGALRRRRRRLGQLRAQPDPLKGTSFAFLGATLGRYSFGFADGKLSAIVGEGTSLRVLDATEAFDALAAQLAKRG